MPARHNISIWKGNTLNLPISIATLVNGAQVPVDLTGSELVFKATFQMGNCAKVPMMRVALR